MDKSGSIAAKALEFVNVSCYVWGARGQIMNTMENLDAWIAQREASCSDTSTNEKNIARVKKLYAKRLANGIETIRAFDCSGFVYYVYSQCGLMSTRMSAASYYSRCAKTDKASLHAGDLVFHHNGNKVSHVGIYIGNGRVIHCKGRDVGVIEEALSAYSWNRFGRWAGVYDNSASTTENPANVLTLGSLNIRTGSGKSHDVIGVVRKNTRLPYVGTDTAGEKWYKVMYNGQTGYITSKPQYTRLVA